MNANEVILPVSRINGSPIIPGDKSISHRALIFGAMAEGTTEVFDILNSDDVNSTSRCLQQLGVKISTSGNLILVESQGIQGLKSPDAILDCGNSGTTIRLLSGMITGLDGLKATLTGDSSLRRRPMNRVATPLRKMGAQIELTQDEYAPLQISGKSLLSAHLSLPVASAQIKTAIILAALNASGTTTLTGKIQSRDHTERMLKDFGVELEVGPDLIQIPGKQSLKPTSIQVPGDPSTAAFWIAGACILPGSDLILERISLNPTRMGFVRVLQRMGADIQTEITSHQIEPVGRIRVRSRTLRGVEITNEEVPSLIDEVPLLAVLGSQCEGELTIQGAEELRVKESDRLEALTRNLRAMGAKIETQKDGFRIHGVQRLHGATLESDHDHRIAMAFSIAALIAQGPTRILNSDCVSVSYPGFFATLRKITQ